MKIVKKILAGVVSAAVIVSALAVPTAADLTNTPKTVTKSGQDVIGNKTIRYGGDLTATKTYARASVSCTTNASLYVCATTYVPFDEKSLLIVDEEKDAISGKSLTVTASNINLNSVYDITDAEGQYRIGASISFNLELS